MEQDLSYKTAMHRTKPSAPMRYIERVTNVLNPYNVTRWSVLDYGCGRGFDAEHYRLDKYDPYYFPTEPIKKYSYITCNYVLNVVSEPIEANIFVKIFNLLLPGGEAFFSVRDDIPELGIRKSGYFQRRSSPIYNEFLEERIRFNIGLFHVESRKFVIYRMYRGPDNT